MSSSRERLSGMMKLLQEKSHDLELREGNAAVLLDTANELLLTSDENHSPPHGAIQKLTTKSCYYHSYLEKSL